MSDTIFYSLLGTAVWLVVAWLMHRHIAWQRRMLRFSMRQAQAYLDLYRAESNYCHRLMIELADSRKRIQTLAPNYKLPEWPESGEEMRAAVDRVKHLLFEEVFAK